MSEISNCDTWYLLTQHKRSRGAKNLTIAVQILVRDRRFRILLLDQTNLQPLPIRIVKLQRFFDVETGSADYCGQYVSSVHSVFVLQVCWAAPQ